MINHCDNGKGTADVRHHDEMKMRKTRFFVQVLLVLLAANCHTGEVMAAEVLDIEVMSFNIRYGTAPDGENHWKNRKDLVCDVIRQHSPDVIGLQEALRFQIDEIRKNLPEYGEIGVGRNGGTKGEYSVILYRTGRFKVDKSGTFWLSDSPQVPSAHWGNAIFRICTWGRFVEKRSGFAFYLFNTHLDHQSQTSREKSVRLIVDFIEKTAQHAPFILTGDFNAGENNPAIEYLKGKGTAQDRSPLPLVDTFRVLHPEATDIGTFHRFQGTSTGQKIDYIFVPPDIRVLKASIVRINRNGRYPSDHFPVTARLQLQEK